MKDSAERLEMYMQEEYINNPSMGSADMGIAIRDLLTDLIHVGQKYDVNISSIILDAEEVFEEERDDYGL